MTIRRQCLMCGRTTMDKVSVCAACEQRPTVCDDVLQNDTHDNFFLLPPPPRTGAESSTKMPRSSFHTRPQQSGKRFATANGFARTKREKGCCCDTGKGCSGKPSLSLEERRQPEQASAAVKLVAEATVKLAALFAVSAPRVLAAMLKDLIQGLEPITGRK